MDGTPRKPRRIDAIEKRLYERDSTSSPDNRHSLEHDRQEVRHAWGSNGQGSSALKMPSSRLSLFHYFFITALVFVIGAGGFFWLSTLRGQSTLSAENIVIEVNAKELIDGGEDIDLNVAVRNANSANLELVDLVIEYPLSNDGLEGEVERIRRPIGTIPANSQMNQAFDVQLFGAEGEERRVSATLEYRISGSNAIFTKTEDTLIGIRSAPVVLVVDAPERLVSGQSIPVNLTLTSNAREQLSDISLVVDYPPGFTFSGAIPSPSVGNSIWEIGTLDPGEQIDITINGELTGSLNSGQTFRFRSGIQSVDDNAELDTVLASFAHVVELEDTFLAVDVELNNEETDRVAYRSSDEVRGEITLTNTQDQPLTDIRVRGQWVGQLLDTDTLRVTRGRFDSAEQTMLWSQDGFSNLGRIDPGQSETLSFSFDIKNPGDNVINPTMDLFVDIRATGLDGSIFEANTVATRSVIINSHVVLEQETLHASGALPSSGPMPPRVGQTTVYTLYWNIHNSANALADATVVTRLPDHVAWVGQTSPQSERMIYNTETRELVWDMGGIVAGAGFGSPEREVWFQVAVTPSATDLGNPLDLTREVVFQATDTFTEQPITVNRAKHTTRLKGDTVENHGLVQ